MDQLQIKGHYGDIKNYGRYYYTVASTALYALSIAIVLLALITTEANISRTVQYAKSKELLNAQAEEYQNIYKKEFEQLEPVFTHARSMNSAVELADRIRRNSRVSPLDFMIELSKVFSQPEIEGVKVIQIDWSLEQVDNKKGVEVVSSLQPDLTSESDIRHIGILKGYIDVSKENYRGSVDRLNLVINELLKHERILKVEAIDMPVEVRSEKGFADESGIARKSSLSSQNGMFSLRITMKGPSRA